MLAISCAASACRSLQPASAPVVRLEPDQQALDDGVARVEYHGIPGLFFTFEAWKTVLIMHLNDKKDLQISLAGETVRADAAERREAQLTRSMAMQQWRATYGPWLGFAGGLTAAAVVFGILLGVVKPAAQVAK